MKYNVQIFVGHNVAGTPTLDSETICKALDNMGAIAYTAIPCAGSWKGERESTTCILFAEVCATCAETLRRVVVPALCADLQQEAIMYRADPVSILEFITA